MLLYFFSRSRLGAETTESLWIRALRQLLVHEVEYDARNSSVDRIVFVVFTLLVQVNAR